MAQKKWDPMESGTVDLHNKHKKIDPTFDKDRVIDESIRVIEERLPQWKLVVVNEENVDMIAIQSVIRNVKRIFNSEGHTPHVSEKKEKMQIIIGITFSEKQETLSFHEEDEIFEWTTHHIIVPSAVELAVQLTKLGKRYAA